jgi:TPR repeat protein
MCAKPLIRSIAFVAILYASPQGLWAQAQDSTSDFVKQWRETKQMYDQGNHNRACANYLIMAYAEIVDGAHAMGYCYWDGKGVPQSFIKAAQYYECAALQGYFRSQLALAMMIYEGKANAVEGRDAYFWFSIAATNPDAPLEGKNAAATMRDEAAKTLKPDQIRKTQLSTSRWRATAQRSCVFE